MIEGIDDTSPKMPGTGAYLGTISTLSGVKSGDSPSSPATE